MRGSLGSFCIYHLFPLSSICIRACYSHLHFFLFLPFIYYPVSTFNTFFPRVSFSLPPQEVVHISHTLSLTIILWRTPKSPSLDPGELLFTTVKYHQIFYWRHVSGFIKPLIRMAHLHAFPFFSSHSHSRHWTVSPLLNMMKTQCHDNPLLPFNICACITNHLF